MSSPQDQASAQGARRSAAPMPGPVPPSGPVPAAGDGPAYSVTGAAPGDVAGRGKLGKLKAAWKTDDKGRTTFRLMPPQVLWWVWLVFAAVNIIDLAIQAHDRFAVQVIVAIAVVTGLMYACALRPRVVTDEAGVTVRNPFRDYQVPWSGITGIFVGDSVEVACLRNPPKSEKTIYSWALYSPRRSRARAEMRTGVGSRQARQRHDSRARRRFQVPDATQFARMPDQAKDLLTKHPSHIMAGELARRLEASRTDGAGTGAVAGRWAFLPIVAVIIPVAALIAVIVAR